jgi:hypothetical protein
MTAGVSPVSPVVRGTPASRTAYEATPLTPTVEKATAVTKADPPSPLDPTLTQPRQPNDGFSGFSTYA